MIPVVTPQEMFRIEKRVIEGGISGEALMREGGRKVATVVDEQKGIQTVLLLVGKGNNGGDAYVAGLHLLEWGVQVRAFLLYPTSECKPLNRKFGEKFVRAGGSIEKELDFSDVDLILDGIFGIGFEGEVEEHVATAIRKANQSGKPILAIDIPSGLNATTGEGPQAIRATQTVAMQFPKIGFFLRDGWNSLGKLRVEEVGFPREIEVKPVAWIPKLEEMKLPPIVRNQHKYQRGFVLGFGGSEALRGAVKLTGLAALHTGAGIVKIFSLEDLGATADELICQRWNAAAWKEALTKAQAVFVGPGLGRKDEVKQWLAQHLKEIAQPCVLDADALFFLRDIAHWPSRALLTPHRGEMGHLLGRSTAEEEAFLRACQDFVEQKNVLLVLKGAPTFVMAKGQLPVIIPRGDPGMATAGSGDILTGILASLLAQGKEFYEAAILGVTLHALAGEAAAKAKTSYGYSASDLIAFLPEAIHYFIRLKPLDEASDSLL